MRSAGAEKCAAIVFCIDDRQFDSATLDVISSAFPDVKIFVRAFDRVHLLDIKKSNISGAKREVFESAIHLAKQAMVAIDLDEVLIDEVDREYRQLDCDRLEAQREANDMFAGRHLGFGLSGGKRESD